MRPTRCQWTRVTLRDQWIRVTLRELSGGRTIFNQESPPDGRNSISAPYSGYFQREAPPPERTLTEVGPGTPMGEYFRRFWHPVCLAEELGDAPKNDPDPGRRT